MVRLCQGGCPANLARTALTHGPDRPKPCLRSQPPCGGRRTAAAGEPQPMAKAPSLDEADLERELLRKGVVALRDGHTRCADCGRTPLVGEHLHRYARGATV